MNISGIRPSDGFYEKNIKKIGPEISSPITENNQLEEEKNPTIIDRDVAASLSISKEGKAASKNIEKAVINMEKDTSIHRYQRFIQNIPAPEKEDNRGLENFSL